MIIIISGTSSSGKSSLCQALFEKLGESWLYFSTDGYLSMLGPTFLGLHPDNQEVCVPNDICYAKKHDDGTYEIVPGKLCSKLFSTIPDVVDLLAQQGFNIILDSFLTTKDDIDQYKKKFESHTTLFVYLYANEKVINQRENDRKDRLRGSAINWMKLMNHQSFCNLSFDSGIISIDKMCDQIIKTIGNE